MLLIIQLKVVGNRPYAESVLQLKQSEAIQGVIQMGARHVLAFIIYVLSPVYNQGII